MRIPGFGIFVLTLFLAACGSGGGGESVSLPINFVPAISITFPTTDPTFSEICNGAVLGGDAGFGTSAKCCNGTAEELTGVRVTWTNVTAGTSGQAFQSVQLCPFVFLCNHIWSASVPLVLGDNQITVTASDTTTGAVNTDTITINKPASSYTVSGTFSSHLGAPPGGAHSELKITGVGANSSHAVSILPSGAYGMSCLTVGTYTLTPSSTINYDFSPANRNIIVAGADVIGQDFTAPAFLISGRVTFANSGAGVQSQAIGLSGSSSAATASTASDGSYNFLVPNGTYTVTPIDLFGPPPQTTPPNRTVTVNNADLPAQDFVR